MAKKAKTEKEGHGVSAIRGNGFDPEAVKSFVERIENVQDEIDEKMADAKEECAPLRDDIAAIKKEAHDAGLPRRELNLAISKRRTLRRIDAARDRLSEEQQDNFDKLELALGAFKDTPLAKAALAGAARSGSVGASA